MLQLETEAMILQTAEIISLLYEATQGPQLPTEPPVLNPTGGVTGKKPVVLNYKKDPTRPGGGVFVAPGKVSDYDLPEGVVVSGSSDGEGSDAEGEIFCHHFGLLHVDRANAYIQEAQREDPKKSRRLRPRVLPQGRWLI